MLKIGDLVTFIKAVFRHKDKNREMSGTAAFDNLGRKDGFDDWDILGQMNAANEKGRYKHVSVCKSALPRTIIHESLLI